MQDRLHELLQSLRERRVYDLEQPRTAGMPVPPAHSPGYAYALHVRHRDALARTPGAARTSASGLIVTKDHAGTHIDALSHQASNLHLYGGAEVTPEVETSAGFTVHGIETMAPIITRGVLLDVCAARGGTPLPPRALITVADLLDAARLNDVTVRPGDAVLVRTGYGRFWSEPATYLEAAGVSPEASEWVAEQRIGYVGADNRAWDVPGGLDARTGEIEFGHLHLIARCGIPIVENLALEELSRDRCAEFLFVCVPLKFVGATGSPVRPLAIA